MRIPDGVNIVSRSKKPQIIPFNIPLGNFVTTAFAIIIPFLFTRRKSLKSFTVP